MLQAKAEALDMLRLALVQVAEEKQQDAGSSPEAAPHADRLWRTLLAAVAEPHFRIAHAALACLQQLVLTAPALEHSLDRLLPQLFTRTCDPKPQVSAAACGGCESSDCCASLRHLYVDILELSATCWTGRDSGAGKASMAW